MDDGCFLPTIVSLLQLRAFTRKTDRPRSSRPTDVYSFAHGGVEFNSVSGFRHQNLRTRGDEQYARQASTCEVR
jgi:hypothetical protein